MEGPRIFTEPFTVLVLVLALALAWLWARAPRARGLFVVTLLFLVLATISTPAAGRWALATLEDVYPPDLDRPADVQAIVVLGGAVAHHDPVLARSQLDAPAVERTWHGYRLFRYGKPCPILLSGGKDQPEDVEPPPSHVMAEELRRLGVGAEWLVVEDESRTTTENAVECARIAGERGWTHIMLVTDAQHLPRAVALFRAQGLEVVPSGCRYRTLDRGLAWWHFVPCLAGLGWFHEAAHEWRATLAARLRGEL